MAKNPNNIKEKEDEILREMSKVIEAKSFYCPNCGKVLIDKFCPECNKKSKEKK